MSDIKEGLKKADDFFSYLYLTVPQFWAAVGGIVVFIILIAAIRESDPQNIGGWKGLSQHDNYILFAGDERVVTVVAHAWTVPICNAAHDTHLLSHNLRSDYHYLATYSGKRVQTTRVVNNRWEWIDEPSHTYDFDTPDGCLRFTISPRSPNKTKHDIWTTSKQRN